MALSPSNAENILDSELQADGVDLLDLNVPEARVKLRPHDANRVRVRGFMSTSRSESHRERRGVSIRHSKDRLYVFRQELSLSVSDWRTRVRPHPLLHLDVRLPPGLDVTTRAPGGAIDAASLTGTVDLTVHGGSVHGEQLDGPLRLHGSGGALTVENMSGPSLHVQWASGPVNLKQVTDAQLSLEARGAPTTVQAHRGPADLHVHGAPLTLTDLDGPCDAEVRGHSLTYHGRPTHDTSLRTVGGPVQAHLPSTHAASLIVTGARVALDDDFDFEGETVPHRIEGTLNGGGPGLALRAVQGTASCQVQQRD